jgi:hypothetical protein
MAFLEEDGTGLAAANSYGNVAGFKAYHKDRGNDLPTGTSSGGIEDALVNGTDYVDRRFRTRFIGRRKEDVQRLQWPRTLARYRDGRLIDPDSLPQELLEAVYEYGLISLSEELAPVPTVDESGALVQRTRVKVGPIETETEFAEGAQKTDFKEYPLIDALLRELITPKSRAIH